MALEILSTARRTSIIRTKTVEVSPGVSTVEWRILFTLPFGRA